MIKKSQLYRTCMEEFFRNQQTTQNLIRISALGDEHQEIVNIAQQAGSESAIEILIGVLERLNLIENDCNLTYDYRLNVILECEKLYKK